MKELQSGWEENQSQVTYRRHSVLRASELSRAQELWSVGGGSYWGGESESAGGQSSRFPDEKGVDPRKSLRPGSVYTWLIFQQQQHLSKDLCQRAPRVPCT